MKYRAAFKPVLVLTLSTALLASCGGSKLNPFNWFGRSKAETVNAMDVAVLADPRQMVDTVKSFKIDRTPGGAILRVVGLPPTQGYWDAELVAQNEGQPVKGVLTFEFRIEQPTGFERAGTPTSREVVVAHYITNNSLNGVRTIRIRGARNARSIRRR